MRRAACIVLGFAATATAEPRPPVWTDYVGDYTGRLAWTGCVVPGVKTATLALDAIDGALTFDLAPAGGGLRALSLVDDQDVEILEAQQGDVKLTVRRIRPDAIAVAIDLTSGCRVRATLVRPTTKVPACDRLLAAARIASHCTKLTAPALEDPTALAKERWKSASAERCTARATAAEMQIIDAGCMPVAEPANLLLGAQCRQAVSDAEKLKRCASAPRESTQIADRVIGLARFSSGAERSVVEASCRQGHEMIVELAAYSRCPL